MSQVKTMLGPPDDVRPAERYRPEGVVWCYGTHGHGTFSTLGKVGFVDGKASWRDGAGGEPPSTKLISEGELDASLQRLGSYSNFANLSDGYDPLKLIRSVNFLIPKGKAKAVAIIGELSRVSGDFDQDWFDWLVRVLFTNNGHWERYDAPWDDLNNKHLKFFRHWDTYPIALQDDVPFLYYEQGGVGGLGGPFYWYLDKHQADWSIRTKKLVPPDDPLLSAERAANVNAWPSSDVAETLQKEALLTVRNVFQPIDLSDTIDSLSQNQFELIHQGFLKLHCYWDVAKEAYVSRSSKALNDAPKEFQNKLWELDVPNEIKIKVHFQQKSSVVVAFNLDVTELGDRPISNAVLIAERADGLAQYDWLTINSTDGFGGFNSSIDKELAKPPHKASSLGGGISSGFSLPKTTRFHFVILFNGKRYVSPNYKI